MKNYPRGNILFWQGDPVETIYVVLSGAIKISSVSEGGRVYVHDILGPGHLLGATDYFLNLKNVYSIQLFAS